MGGVGDRGSDFVFLLLLVECMCKPKKYDDDHDRKILTPSKISIFQKKLWDRISHRKTKYDTMA